MPSIVYVFVSHAWAGSECHEQLIDWIFGAAWQTGSHAVDFVDVSIPDSSLARYARVGQDPTATIHQRILISDVLVIPAGPIAADSAWIDREVAGALRFGKPILAVGPLDRPDGSSAAPSPATDLVGWDRVRLLRKLVELARPSD